MLTEGVESNLRAAAAELVRLSRPGSSQGAFPPGLADVIFWCRGASRLWRTAWMTWRGSDASMSLVLALAILALGYAVVDELLRGGAWFELPRAVSWFAVLLLVVAAPWCDEVASRCPRWRATLLSS